MAEADRLRGREVQAWDAEREGLEGRCASLQQLVQVQKQKRASEAQTVAEAMSAADTARAELKPPALVQ